MKATRELKEEHGGIKVMLAILGKVCDRLDAGQPVDRGHLDGILEFLKVFVDKCHHAKEEDHLFPAMEKAGIPREGGPIGVMLIEHQAGRDFIRGMANAAGAMSEGDPGAAKRFVANARSYTDLLLQHIDKEDNILYPMAEARLPGDADGTLAAEFERVEEERVGHGRHEEFHRMMDRLKSIYGV
ncbi:MAG: hemerythrin domain-containing protein [Deltaproteobacteria bacterium]